MRTNGAVVLMLLALGMFAGCTGEVGELEARDSVQTELRGRNCGDGQCKGAESCSSCPADCGVCAPPPPTGPVCGNASCESAETCSSCPGDCGTCTPPPPTGPVCGNATCESGESCSACPEDCGACATTTIDCRNAATWPAAWTALEVEVLALVNQRRAAGAVCGGSAYPAVAALTANAALREASRCHSLDMALQNYFSHTGLDGSSPSARMAAAGYLAATSSAENIAAGQATAAAVVDGWMASSGHCVNIMAASSKDTGVGSAFSSTSTYGTYWTQTFGATSAAPSPSVADAGTPPVVDAGSSTVDAGTAALDGGIPSDVRTIAGVQIVGPTKAIVSLSGAQRTDGWGAKWLWILSDGSGSGFGSCGSGWDTAAQVGLVNLFPGKTYRVEIEYLNGVRSPARTFVAPALTPETRAPITGATATGSATCGTLGVSASDDTGVQKTEFFVNGTLVGTQECGANCMNVQILPVTNGAITGMGTYYVTKPANLVGTAVTVHAKVYDYSGNFTVTTPITLSL